MSAVPFADVLSFARAHATKLEDVKTIGRTSAAGKEDASHLHYRQVAPLFDARGQSTRVAKQDVPVKEAALSEKADRAPRVKDELKRRRKRKKTEGEVPATAGSSHFDIPNTEVTPEIEQTFKMLEMRPYLFKDQHFKKAMKWKQPSFFGVGTVVDDPRDFYSTRVPRKQRKQTLGEELMSEAGLEQTVDRRVAVLKEKEAKLKAVKQRKNAAKKRKPIKRAK